MQRVVGATLATLTVALAIGTTTPARAGSDLMADDDDAAPADAKAAAPAPAIRTDLGNNALPGGERIGDAAVMRAGEFGAAFSGLYGFRDGLLSTDHKMRTGAGSVALSYTPLSWLGLALEFDGRYVKHYGASTTGTSLQDSGFVGDPHIFARAVHRFGDSADSPSICLALNISAPGQNAPSIVLSAVSIDARLLLSGALGKVHYALNLGGKLDNSANSVTNPQDLSLSDQVSLGVSQWNSVVGGVRAWAPVGPVRLGVEVEATDFVGAGAPGLSTFGAIAGSYDVSTNWTATAFVGGTVLPAPTIVMNSVPLIPYDPSFTVGLGLETRFGIAAPVAKKTTTTTTVESDHTVVAVATASLKGKVTDENGSPVPGASVTVAAHDGTRKTITTDDDGSYRVDELPLGKATRTIEAPDRTPSTTELVLTGGDNAVPNAMLQKKAPAGELKFIVRSFSGKGIVADIEVVAKDGDATPKHLTTAADGSAELDVEPGAYQVKVSAAGYKAQTRPSVVVVLNGTSIVNIDLRKK